MGTAVKALTNFPRCWERPVSNHPEETAGQLETTFREECGQMCKCIQQSISSDAFLLSTSVNTFYNSTNFKKL